MIAENYSQVNEILRRILDTEPSRRKEILDNSDVSMEVRAEVESLLALEDKVGDFLSLSVTDFSKDFVEISQENPGFLAGSKIGNYEIIAEIGQGGMGAVYLAQRADGKFEQRVALKLLKRELNTSALRRRFQQEREILAALENPFIARLLDAGTTDEQIPFLAMEYVEGLPINQYCNKNNLGLDERLDLFRKVCGAVTFAHRNLIVHRDLKPSNILVDADGNPKLLDFGISKILSNDTEKSESLTVTNTGAMTFGYASPEQLRQKSVTTATDIYSLGIILYELLSGHRPFENKENDLQEIYKAVLETETPPPSETLRLNFRHTDHRSFEKSETRQLSDETKSNFPLSTLPRETNLDSQKLRGDLDNIVLKSLRKEPERRYSSVEAFAEDIHRYLRGLPVSARPNTFFYRTGKFFRRNRISATIACFLIMAIAAGIAATIWQSKVAAAERDRARLEAEKVKKINAYTTNILNFSNPHWLSSNPKRNREATVAQALDEALKNIDRDLANEPEIQAEILQTIGQTYIGQGQYEKSEKILRQSIEKFDEVFGVDNLRSMQTSIILGDAVYLQGNFGEAEELYSQAIEYFRFVAAEDKSQERWLAIALNDLGNINLAGSEDEKTEKLYREAVELSKDFTGRDAFVYPIALGNLGLLHNSRGFPAEALQLYDQAGERIISINGDHSMEYGNLLSKIATAYNEIGNYDQAESYFRRSYDILLNSLGEENNYSISVMNRLSYNYYKQEKFEEAEKMIAKSLEIQRKIYPKGHLLTANAERILGGIYTKTARSEKGESLLKKSLEFYSQRSKKPTRDIALTKMALGANLIAQKRFDEAVENLNSALEISLNLVGENYYLTKECRKLLEQIAVN